MRHEVGKLPAPRALEATCASSDEASSRKARGARLCIPPHEDAEQALISSAADEHEACNIVICKETERDKELAIDDIDSER